MVVLILLNHRVFSTHAVTKFPQLEIKGLTNIKAIKSRQDVTVQRKKPFHKHFGDMIKWTNIWPSAATFHYSVVPFPIRQGYCKNLVENSGLSPSSYANTELMKIPNFLHLTKAHVGKHCEVLKKFCTKWPSGLNSDESITEHYPIRVIQYNYVFTASSIRDPRARVARLRVPVSRLGLREHEKRKLIRLTMGPGLGNNTAKYDWSTDELELVGDRCPSSIQNADYLRYVFTVLVLESKKIEQWELGAPAYDWLAFNWMNSKSRQRLIKVCSHDSDDRREGKRSDQRQLDSDPIVGQYREALEHIWRENDPIRSNQWPEPPRYPRKRHNPYPPIENVPFEPVPGADQLDALQSYKNATRQLMGLS